MSARWNKDKTKKVLWGIIIVLIWIIVLIVVVPPILNPDVVVEKEKPPIIPDTPSELKCNPPLENYNGTCSCGPEKELTIQPGGGKICAPMNT